MRDELNGKASNNTEQSSGKPPVYESLILNMDDSDGQGTHWVSLYIIGNSCYYFDSFGFEPPIEVGRYCSEKTWIFQYI